MTLRQIEIGELLLSFLREKSRNEASKDQYSSLLNNRGYDYYTDVVSTVQRLNQKDLVEYRENGYFLKLTDKGHDAAELGLSKYLKQQKDAAELELKEKRTSIRYTKWSFVLASVALLHSIYPVINIPEFFGSKTPVDTNSNTEDREGNAQSTESESFITPEQIDEVKKSLLYDSVFISEFTRELKKVR